MRTRMYLIVALALWGCGTHPLDLDNDILSDMLSLSNRTRRAIQDPADPSRIVGLAVEVDIINVGALPIDLRAANRHEQDRRQDADDSNDHQ